MMVKIHYMYIVFFIIMIWFMVPSLFYYNSHCYFSVVSWYVNCGYLVSWIFLCIPSSQYSQQQPAAGRSH